jgi:hypothetical protein
MRLPAFVAFAALAGLPRPTVAQQRTPSLVERTGSLRSPPITESSGVAVSRKHAGVLWTHNDSGDGPMLFATNLAGDDLGRYLVPGASNYDWEDLALGPCPEQPRDCLYIADTGDNNERRRTVTVYVVAEPAAPPRRANDDEPARVTARARSVRVKYPDGAHDVEAIWVEPDGAVQLVTKGTNGPMLRYVVRRPALDHDTATAEPLERLAMVPQRALGRMVTGAAISPNGERVVIRTYTELFFFRRARDGRLNEDGPSCWLGVLEPQGEGVAFLDDSTLVLTSEGVLGQPGPMHRVKC